VPKDFRLKTDIPLTATALEAVRVSEHWRSEKNSPSQGPDGRVMYSYGAGLPTVVCAPLRVCIIELQAGEKIVGEPHIGDSVRWNISPAMYGTGDQATCVIILKPQTPALDQKQPVAGADLIVLSEHVDYSDRLGWKDPFSSAQYTAPQQDYTNKYNLDGVYTPQLVVDGLFELVGSDGRAATSAIQKAIREQRVSLAISRAARDGSQLTMHIESSPDRNGGGSEPSCTRRLPTIERSHTLRAERTPGAPWRTLPSHGSSNSWPRSIWAAHSRATQHSPSLRGLEQADRG
jgi:hypothetical protein